MPLAPLPRRTLLIAPATLSDAVLSQPLVAALRGLDPLGTIDVVAAPALAPVYRAMAGIATVIETAIPSDRLALLQRWRLARRLAANGYDRAFVLHEAATEALLPWLAGIPERIGAAPGSRIGLYTRPASPAHRLRSRADRFAAMAFGAAAPLPPALKPPMLERRPVVGNALAARLALDAAVPLILLAPGSELGPTSEWPMRHYAALAARIQAHWPQVRVGLIGRPRDRSTAAQIALLSGQPLANWCGQLDTTETMALIGRAAVVVTTESATMHLTAALGRPHVAIYGAGDPRAERVADLRRQVLWLRLDCGPCGEAHCRLGHLHCLNLQSPEAVFAAVRKALRYAATA